MLNLYKVTYEHGFCSNNGYRDENECYIMAGDSEDCEAVFLALMEKAGLDIEEDAYLIKELRYTINEEVGI